MRKVRGRKEEKEERKKEEYRVRQRGCSLTHSARTPPAVHRGITIGVDEIEFEKKIFFGNNFWGGGFFFGGPLPHFFFAKIF